MSTVTTTMKLQIKATKLFCNVIAVLIRHTMESKEKHLHYNDVIINNQSDILNKAIYYQIMTFSLLLITFKFKN